MNGNNIYRDLTLLVAGLTSIAILGSVAVLNFAKVPQDALSDLETGEALRLLMAAEYGRLFSEFGLSPHVTIAIGSDLSSDATGVLQRFGHRWIQEHAWEGNRGVPPDGTVLVRELRIDQGSGFVTVIVGEAAGDLACGYTVESEYEWRGGWADRRARAIVC